MTPSLSEWLAYHFLKSVGFYGGFVSVLAIPTAFVMWACIGFLGWYGGLKMSKRTWVATWVVTTMAGVGIILIAATWPTPVASVANVGPPEGDGQAAYERHDNVGQDGLAAYQRHDYATALQVLRPLADHGDARAQYVIGVMYYNGEGVSLDSDQAVKWFRLAADQRLANAQHNLGHMYAKGEGVSRDYSEAVKWFGLAADQGLADAQYNLGLLYENGWGVSRDYAEAAKWYRRAADQGFAPAQGGLGLLYANGRGVSQDYEQGVKWYRRAADQGLASAQNNLGLLYAEGHGVPQDYVRAYMWLTVATATGVSNGSRVRDHLSQLMSAAQLAEAQRLARDWKPAGPRLHSDE